MRKTISSAKSVTTAFEPCASRKRKALKSWPVRRACRSRRGTTYASPYDRTEPPSVCKMAPHRSCWVKWQNPALPRPSSDFTCKMGSNYIWRTFSVDPSGSSRFLRQAHLDTPSDDDLSRFGDGKEIRAVFPDREMRPLRINVDSRRVRRPPANRYDESDGGRD